MKPCKITVLSFLLISLFLASAPAWAQDWEPHWPFHRGDITWGSQVIFNAAMFNGNLLVAGDEIAVFTPDGICAGGMQVKADDEWGATTGLFAFGDDDATEAVDGFFEGDEMTFKVWLHDVDGELNADITDIVLGEPIWYSEETLICSIEASTANIPPVMDLLDNALTFGMILVGNSATQSVRVHNNGGGSLTVDQVTFEGDGSEYFSADLGEGFSCGWRETKELPFTFAPGADGNFEVIATIHSNDEANPEVTVTLTGAGHVPIPPTLELSTSDYTFPDTRLGRSRSLTLVISNTGEMTLTIMDAALTGDPAFSTNFSGEFDINGGSTGRLLVTFTPEEATGYSAVLTITSNDPDNETVEVQLHGAGVEAGNPELALNESQHFFPGVIVGTEATWRMVVMNIGGSDLWVHGISSDNDAFTTDFSLDSLRLRPDDFYYVTVSFIPGEVAYYDGVITVVSDDPANPEVTCMVGGVGSLDDGLHFRYYPTQPNHSLFVEAVSLDDNALVEGDEIGVFTETGMCGGGGVVNGNGQAGVRAYADDEESEIVDGFAEGESFTFVVWDASANSEAYATADFAEGPETFTSNGLSRLTLTAGSPAPAPRVRLTAIEHYFGQVDYDDHMTKSWSFGVENIGVGDLIVDAIESDLAEFQVAIDGNFPVTLGQNGRLPVTVTFAPTAEQAYVGRLTILSNDPVDSVRYVDVYGTGVVEVIEPDIRLDAANYFFGGVHKLAQGDDPYEYILEVGNVGGGQLFIEDVSRNGSDAFTTSYPNQRVFVDAGEVYNLSIWFKPLIAGQFDAAFTITSNDPVEEQVDFAVRGYSFDSADHFLHHSTALTHTITVDDAIIHTLEEQDLWLVAGDEVAVFTPTGLCAGHTVVTQPMVDNTSIPLTAWSDDADTPFDDGFHSGDAFTFKFWDWTVTDELDAEAEFVNGQDVFTVSGASTVLLYAIALHSETQITVDELVKQFGAVQLGEEGSRVFTFTNTGGMDLVISGVESDMVEFSTDFAEEVTLGQNESLDLTVYFAPTNRITYEATLTVLSNDPDNREFPFHPVGAGASNEAGHYNFFRTDRNHSVLIESADIGGAGPAIGDEFAVFTAAGFCAGAYVITDPDADIGIAAMGDDSDTPMLIEGFARNETMTIHFWDASQGREYVEGDEDIEVDIVQGSLSWRSNGLTFISVTVTGVFGIRPVAPIEADEGEQVAFNVDLLNAGEDQFEFTAEGVPEDASFIDNGDNTGAFTWDVSYETLDGPDRPLRQSFEVTITATSGVLTDHIDVEITIFDVNRAPEVAQPLENDQLTVQEDCGETLVADLDEMFVDQDGDVMFFYYRGRAGITQRIDRGVTNQYYVTPQPDSSGQFELRVVADDLLGDRDEQGRTLRRVDTPDISFGRTLRSVNGELPADPARDLSLDYVWTLIVTPVNDAPMITQPTVADTHRVDAVNELEQILVDFLAEDVDNLPAELTWSVLDQDGLPGANGDPWTFVDNGDGSARFTWTPDQNMARAEDYLPTFRVSDPEDAGDVITLRLRVHDVNRPPDINPDAPDTVTIVEDGRDQLIADLADIFTDEDLEDAVLEYTIMPNPAQLGLQIVGTQLISNPLTDFNTFPPRRPHLQVSVTGRDHANDEAVWAFRVAVTPVNDSPAAFNLTAPADNYRETDWWDRRTTFSWEAAAQNRYEIDTARYTVRFTLGQDTFKIGPLLNTEFRDVPLWAVADSLRIAIHDRDEHRIVWTVIARDPDFTVSANRSYTLILQQLSVPGVDETMPTVFYMAPNYPNPFNSGTTVKFGLPQPADVEVSVWDMHGRQVAVLANGKHSPGRYEAFWDAAGQTSGIYIIRMSAGSFRALQKAILVR
jgi:hypothetical protein